MANVDKTIELNNDVIDLTNVPCIVVVKNISNEGMWVPLAKSHTSIILDAGKSLKAKVETTEELAYYLSLENLEEFSVDIEDIDSNDEGSKD